MKRALLGSVMVVLLATAGWAVAETPAPKAPAAAPHDATTCPMGGGMMGGGMMGGGMMGGGMGPMMMGGPGTKVAVKNIDKGVTITLTSSDPAAVARLQKMAEAMRLMHEAMTPEK
jgi:predicted lipid-binding transport protein (Tim44 family)